MGKHGGRHGAAVTRPRIEIEAIAAQIGNGVFNRGMAVNDQAASNT